jgi:general secretion pathway protein D
MGTHTMKKQRCMLVSDCITRMILCLTGAGVLAAQQPPAQTQGQTQAQVQTQAQAAPVRIGNLSLQNASLTEVIDQLARQLKINYILDPAVRGNIVLNTYGDTSNLDARNLLELILRINGAGMVQEGEIYRIVPLKTAPRILRSEQNPANIQDDEQLMLNMIFLKYVTVEELTKVLNEFVGENASLYSYTPANLLFILDSRRNMRRTMDLISMFDSDTFANQRVRLFEIQNTRPSDIQKDLENVLKSVSLDGKSTSVRFLPVDRINTLIAVAPNPGIFETVEDWLKRLDVPTKIAPGGDYQNYVYRVRYGRAECLAIALNQLFGLGTYGSAPYGGGGFPPFAGGFGGGAYPGVGTPYNPYPPYMGGGAQQGTSAYGRGNTFNSSFGGSGGCFTQGMGAYGGAYGGGYSPYGGGFGYPAFGGYAAQVPAGQLPVGGAAGGAATAQAADNKPVVPPVRVVANPLDNALIIQGDAQQLQSVLKILKDLDIPPRQILLEAKIYSVALTGTFSAGVSAVFQQKSDANRQLTGSLLTTSAGNSIARLQAGTLVGQSRELLAFLNLQENASRTRILSEPSLIATDSIPATITVGTQVPVATSSAQVSAGTSTVTQTISSQNTGVTMQVNARVNPSGVVTLIINQEVSKPAAGAGTLTPSFDQQVVQTQITVQDGDTIAIGGIISENNDNTASGIPGLVHVPVLGFLFGNKTVTRSRSELIIFMTPHVILDESDLIEASNELKERVKKLQKYVKEL